MALGVEGYYAGRCFDGSSMVKGFNAKDLSAFNMDRCGLIIHFDPYAVDCYAAGMYQVEIPWSELKDLIDPKGPVSLLH